MNQKKKIWKREKQKKKDQLKIIKYNLKSIY